jgi:hypothetical protein
MSTLTFRKVDVDGIEGGDLVNCENQEFTGIHHEGGYAEVMFEPSNLLQRESEPCLGSRYGWHFPHGNTQC